MLTNDMTRFLNLKDIMITNLNIKLSFNSLNELIELTQDRVIDHN